MASAIGTASWSWLAGPACWARLALTSLTVFFAVRRIPPGSTRRRRDLKLRPGRRDLHELLAAVDVVGRAGQGRVDHDVHRQRGDILGADDAADRDGLPEVLTTGLEVVAEQRRRQGRVDEARGDEVDPDRRD